MKISVNVDGNLMLMTKEEIASAERAVTRTIAHAGKTLNQVMRQQIVEAKLGQRLANTVRDTTFPKAKPSINAAALVWTKAPHIVGAFEEGATIRGKSGNWLAIPTKYAGPRGGRRSRRRLTPGEWEKQTGLKLRLVLAGNGKGMLITDGARISSKGFAKLSRAKGKKAQYGKKSLPIFILVPQVTLQKRLNLAMAIQKATGNLANLIVSNWR